MGVPLLKAMLMVNRIGNSMYALTDIAVEDRGGFKAFKVALVVEIAPGIRPAFKVMTSLWDPDNRHTNVGISDPLSYMSSQFLIGLLLVLHYNHQCRNFTSFGYNEFHIPEQLAKGAPIPHIQFLDPGKVLDDSESLTAEESSAYQAYAYPTNAVATFN